MPILSQKIDIKVILRVNIILKLLDNITKGNK